MAREQIPKSFTVSPITTTPAPLSSAVLNITSFIIQAPITNTDYITIGDATSQEFQIAPGRDLTVYGDNLDNGTTAYMDFSKWLVKSLSGSQTAVVLYLERF